jgi:hypothetical protein
MMTILGEMAAMNAMRGIYLRSLLLLFGFTALLLIEQLAPPQHGASGSAPAATVGSGHSPA